MSYLFLCYPKCSTCAKARDWLTAHGVDFVERDIKLQNPTADEIRAWHAQSGLPLKKFFNTSGLVYRGLGLTEKLPTMDEGAQYDLLATDGMLVKRPLLIGEGVVLTGFREAEWAQKLQK